MNDIYALGRAMREAERAYHCNPWSQDKLDAMYDARLAFDKALSEPPAALPGDFEGAYGEFDVLAAPPAALCEDEGCPHHGTAHVCIDKPPAASPSDENDPAYLEGPFYYVPMPLNAEGHGPEMDPAKVVRVRHEVWNGHQLSVAAFQNKAVAELFVAALKPPAPTPAPVVKDFLTTGALAAWCRDAARYFENRPTGGEDAAHWANVINAENARKAAAALEALSARALAAEAEAKQLREVLRELLAHPTNLVVQAQARVLVTINAEPAKAEGKQP